MTVMKTPDKVVKRGRPRTSDIELTNELVRQRLDENMALTLAELAVILRMSQSSVHRAAVANDLPVPVYRIGQRWVVPSEPVREFLRKGKPEPKSEDDVAASA